MKRKVFGLLLVVLIGIVAIGCNFSGGTITIEPGGEQTPTNIDLDEVFLNIESQLGNKDSITNDITLPTKFGSVTINWTSDNPNLIDANGHITRPDVDTTVILRCTLTSSTESKRYEVRVTIKAKDIIIDPVVQVASIRAIIEGELGLTYKTQGTVVATSKISFLIQDSTGYILCYLDTDYANDLNIGDEVEVEGTTSAYGGAVQFNKPTYTKIGNTQVDYPTPRVLDKNAYEALNTAVVNIQYVKFEATLAISGKYYNLRFDDSTLNGGLCTPSQDINSYDGNKIEITGFFVYVSGSTTKYVYFMATEIKLADTPTPQPVVAHLDTTKQGTYYGDGVVIVISESEVSVTDATGKVLRYTIYVEDNRYYVLDGEEKEYCTFGDGTVTNSKGTFTKTPPTPTYNTISEVKAGQVGNTYKVKGTVLAVSSVSFLIEDSTGSILVYLGNNFAKDLNVGDEIELEGKTAAYSSTIQFSSATYTKVGTKTVSYPEPRVLTGDDCDALVNATPVTQFVEVEGVLKISGSYINLEIEGAKVKGSIVSTQENLANFNNKVVKVKGYYLYITGSSTKYVNILLTSIEESTTPLPQLEDSTISQVLSGEVGKTYKTTGIIMAISAISVVLQDETGIIICNFGSDFQHDSYAVGMKITVEGPTQVHGGSVQINYPQATIIEEVGATYPKPRDLKKDDLPNLNGQASEYVSLTAKLVKSGKYYNLDMGDEYIFGALATPAEDIDSYLDQNVDIKGYYSYTTTSGGKTYVYFIYTSIELASQPIISDTNYYMVGSSFGNWLPSYDYKLDAYNLSDLDSFSGLYENIDELKAALVQKNIKTVYVLPILFTYEESYWQVPFLTEDNTLAYVDGCYAFKVATAFEVDGSLTADKWYPCPETNNVESLTSSTLFISRNFSENKDEYGFDWNSNPVFIGIDDDYLLVFVDYGVESTEEVAGYGMALLPKIHSDEEIVDQVLDMYSGYFDAFTVVNSMIFPTSVLGTEVTWESNNQAVLESNGTYHMPSEATDVTFTVTVTKGEVTKSTEIIFHVVGVETIASIIDESDFNSYHYAKGVVIGTGVEGFLIKDDTGIIFASTGAYRGDLVIGDEVIVRGPLGAFGSRVEFSQWDLYYAKTGNTFTVTYPEASILDATEFDSLFGTDEVEYIQISGNMEYGEYMSILTVEGSEVAGELFHPNLSQYDGMDITIKGYFIYSVAGYRNFNVVVVTDITVDSAANVDQNKVNRVADDIMKSFDGQVMYYPVNYYPDIENVSVTWSSSNEEVFNLGEVPAYQKTETLVTLTAVVESGDVSKTVVASVIVPAITSVANITADNQDQTFVVLGTIVAATNESVLLQDDSGTIVIYFGKNGCPEKLSVGAKLYYIGTVSEYAGILEFTFGGYYVLDYVDVTYPEPVELDAAGCEALLDTTETKFVKITGDLEINGSYVNFYPVGSEMALSIIAPQADLSELNYKRIILKGYYVYTSGTSTKYPAIMMTEYEEYEWTDSEIVLDIKTGLEALTGYTIYAGIGFQFADGVEVTWASNNENIIANDLTYNAPDSDTEVTLIATITCGEVTDTATVTFLCKGITSIASIKASEDLSEKYVIKGNVLAVSQISFIVQDGSDYIYVYYGNNFAQDLEIGDEVLVRGYVSIYNGLYEFSSEVGYNKTGESITVTNTPDELDGEAFDLLGNTTGFRYVKLTGDYYFDGKYHSFYPVGAESCVANLVRPVVDGLDDVNGERLIITGYYCFAEGQDPRYLNIVVTGFELYEWSDEELVAEAVKSINDIQNYPLVAGLYFTFGERYTITWTSSHENILSSSFEYHVPEVDTLVTLTATITVGEVTDTASCSFLCKAPTTIASVLALEDFSQRVLVKGNVIALSSVSFLVKDSTGTILVYYGSTFEQDLEIGDEVYVRGYISSYNNTLQFGANIGYEKTGEKVDIEYPEPTLLTPALYDALLDSTEIAYVKVKGTLQMSGNYYNFTVEGSNIRGSIVSPTDELLQTADGKEVELTGFYVYTTGSSERFISFIATNLEYETE